MKMSISQLIIFLFLIGFSISLRGQTVQGTSNAITISVGQKPIEVSHADEAAITLASMGISKLPKYYALIVAVSEYANSGPGLPNLEMPTKDAERIYSVLTDHYAFDPQDVIILKNPTREEIINQFERLTRSVNEKENLLIFYAGHGYYDKARDFGYWLPSDAKLSSPSAWISNSTIKDYIGAIKSKHTLLITDACFGGSIFKTRSITTEILRFNEAYKNSSRKALTSGNLNEVPDKSVFLKFLIKSLEENTKVFLSSSELFARIYEPIMNNATSTPQFGVVQGAGDEGGDFIFIKKD